MRTHLSDKNNSATEEDIYNLYDYCFNEVIMNYFHAAIARCVCLMLMKPDEFFEGRQVCLVEGDTTKKHVIKSLNDIFDAHIIVSMKQNTVLTYGVSRSGKPYLGKKLRSSVLNLASMWPLQKPAACQNIAEIIFEKLWALKERRAHLRDLKKRILGIWCIYDNYTVPLSMTACFDDQEKFYLNDATRHIDFDAISKLTRDKISIPYMKNLDEECTEQYLRNCISSKDTLRDVLRHANRSITPLSDVKEQTRIVEMLATKAILSDNKALKWALNTRRALKKARKSLKGDGYKTKRNHISKLIQCTDIVDEVRSGTIQAAFVRIVALCRLAKCKSLTPHNLKIGRIAPESCHMLLTDRTYTSEDNFINIKLENLGLCDYSQFNSIN